MPLYYTLPLLAAFFYALCTLFFKRSFQGGVGITRTIFVSNIVLALMFLPFWFIFDTTADWSLWYIPVLVSLVFFGAQVVTFIGIHVGDVSVMTPIMGSKVLFVALFSSLLLSDPVPVVWWIGAGMSAFAIILLGITDFRHKGGRLMFLSILLGVVSSVLFGFTDVLIQKFAPLFGPFAYISVLMFANAFYSLFFIPFFKKSLFAIDKPTWWWLLGGAFFGGLQGMIFDLAIAYYGKATAVNILYSSRGIWSILLVWMIGHWFSNTERHIGRKAMATRLIGSFILLGAIILVLTQGAFSFEEVHS